MTKLRSIHYPPISKDIEEMIALNKSQIVRCGEHSDYGTITFLYQDDMGGLEVRAIDNSWIQVRKFLISWRPFNNYVDRILRFFDHPPSPSRQNKLFGPIFTKSSIYPT